MWGFRVQCLGFRRVFGLGFGVAVNKTHGKKGPIVSDSEGDLQGEPYRVSGGFLAQGSGTGLTQDMSCRWILSIPHELGILYYTSILPGACKSSGHAGF